MGWVKGFGGSLGMRRSVGAMGERRLWLLWRMDPVGWVGGRCGGKRGGSLR